MGMFDYVKCEMALPGNPPPFDLFQTKDTPDQFLTIYTITKDGRLSWHPYRMETVPKDQRPYPDMPFIGSMRRVEADSEILTDFHGDVDFYDYQDGIWWEFRARFSNGVCEPIRLLQNRALAARSKDRSEP